MQYSFEAYSLELCNFFFLCKQWVNLDENEQETRVIHS